MTHERKKSLAKPLCLTSGILGLIQGIPWTIFSVLAILSYFDSIQIDTNSDSLSNETTYYKLIYNIFLDKNDIYGLPSDRLVQPKEFFIFMWFYLVFSLLWTIVSGTVIWAMIHDQWHLTKGLFGSWATITVLTSIVDIVLMSLLVVDYMKVNNINFGNNIVVCYGLVMSLAARGYVLWIINVIFAAIMTKYTLDVVLKDNNAPTLPIIHGFESSAMTPAWFDSNVKSFWGSPHRDEHDNLGFRDDEYVPPPGHAQRAPSNIYSELARGASSYVNKTPPFSNESGSSNRAGPASRAPPPPREPPFGNRAPPPPREPPFGNRAPPPPKEPPFVNRAPPTKNEPMSFAQEIAHKTATIGRKKGNRSPLYNVPPPVIPDPDYTPPSTPIGKSVLRRESNYDEVF